MVAASTSSFKPPLLRWLWTPNWLSYIPYYTLHWGYNYAKGKITFVVDMGALPQTVLNLCMKFPTLYGIATIRSDKMGARECYLNSTRRAKPRDVSKVVMDVDIVDALEEWHTSGQEEFELMDAPEHIWRVEPSFHGVWIPNILSRRSGEIFDKLLRPYQGVASGKGFDTKAKKKLNSFLCKNLDVFTWRQHDIIGVDPKDSFHYLKIDSKDHLIDKRREILTRKGLRP